jgi:diguanylate cyclase (GGDEF)-like protein
MLFKPGRPDSARRTAAHRYIRLVSGLGWLLLVAIAGVRGLDEAVRVQPEFWVVAAFAAVAGLLPIKVPRLTDLDEVATSTPFTFALLLSGGTATAVILQAVVSLTADLLRHKAPSEMAFNVASYTLSLVAAGVVLGSLAGMPGLEGSVGFSTVDLPAIVVSAATFFLIYSGLQAAASALHQRVPIAAHFRKELLFHVSTTGVLLSLAPFVVLAADQSIFLIPLLVLPITAVYESATASLDNQRLAGKLSRKAEENEYQALHDGLTGLANRKLFHDRLTQAVRMAQRNETRVAVMLMDLDRFKEVNDTLGHHNGDTLLKEVGPRIQSVLRDTDSVSRLGGDEFAMLLPDVDDDEAASLVAIKVLTALSHPFVLEGVTLDLSGSIGIALYPDHGHSGEVLLQRADVAMYIAKENHSGHEVYQRGADQHSARRLALAGQLRQAIENRELGLVYQPKAQFHSGQVKGVEALVRWNHPERGTMAPDEFIPLAEHTGLIRPLTMLVLDTALEQCRRWQDAGIHLTVAVNLSVRNLLDLELPDQVGGLLQKWGLDPHWLELEITESSIIVDPARALSILKRLDDMNVGLAIDDFGTGYSSLSYLKRLPVRELKIDKSFVMGMAEDENDAAIVRSTIELGRNLGLRVIAEGVETEGAWTQLAALGCDIAQGFYLGKPTTAEKLIHGMAESPGHIRPAGSDAPLTRAPGAVDARSASKTRTLGKRPPAPSPVVRKAAPATI